MQTENNHFIYFDSTQEKKYQLMLKETILQNTVLL